MVLPSAMGAVVDGKSLDFQTPLSGHLSPVRAVVPIGFLAIGTILMSKFGLVKSFEIDNGELDHLRPKDCFVLGYELARIDSLLATGEAISQPVHADNKNRIESSCRDAERTYRLNWMAGDCSESWMMLEVAPKP